MSWNLRVTALQDGPDILYALREVYYDAAGMPNAMGPIIAADTTPTMRQFRDNLEDALSRPLHDPDNPQPTPRGVMIPRTGVTSRLRGVRDYHYTRAASLRAQLTHQAKTLDEATRDMMTGLYDHHKHMKAALDEAIATLENLGVPCPND